MDQILHFFLTTEQVLDFFVLSHVWQPHCAELPRPNERGSPLLLTPPKNLAIPTGYHQTIANHNPSVKHIFTRVRSKVALIKER